MKYQKAKLPEGAKKNGSTPVFSEYSVPEALLHRHLAPRDHCGLLKVRKGSLQFVWLDGTPEILDADPGHPIVIAPGRAHRVKVTGPVEFCVEFYLLPDHASAPKEQEKLPHPGEAFLSKGASAQCPAKKRDLP